MTQFLFYGDSFTYGEDAETRRDTWPAHFMKMIGEDLSNHTNFGTPGHSNAGIFLDILQGVNNRTITKDSVVFVGFSNVWRDATTIHPGFHCYNGNIYRTINMHAVLSDDRQLHHYANIMANESEWILYARAFQTALGINTLLDKVGCEYYLIDIILNQLEMQNLVGYSDELFSPMLSGPKRRDIFGYLRHDRTDIHLTPTYHFFSDGYKEIAKIVLRQIPWPGQK